MTICQNVTQICGSYHIDVKNRIFYAAVVNKFKSPLVGVGHRLRPIHTHLALYTMLYNNSTKNRYTEPVHNKTMKIFKIRD